MAEYWFRPKRYGLGAVPVTWQGWAITLAPALLIVVVAIVAVEGAMSETSLVAWTFIAVAATAASVAISYFKTDGEWRWRWGSSDHPSNSLRK